MTHRVKKSTGSPPCCACGATVLLRSSVLPYPSVSRLAKEAHRRTGAGNAPGMRRILWRRGVVVFSASWCSDLEYCVQAARLFVLLCRQQVLLKPTYTKSQKLSHRPFAQSFFFPETKSYIYACSGLGPSLECVDEFFEHRGGCEAG
jgi:hypothetical protein